MLPLAKRMDWLACGRSGDQHSVHAANAMDALRVFIECIEKNAPAPAKSEQLIGKVGTAFCSTASQRGGQERRS